ncbi:type II toxin-antitoxin system PemK/MazF family toxin [Brevundimonas aurifodinae]|uniref:Growth inhibitor PemK n=1 Tax=Brevundimonas subvibrioides TaxID=74313 RepID=A0A258FVX6_9CAUL|nr:MAG: hypothetical protein B7Z42_03850 [Brevundimonas sp. 12-68-7]OYX35902.1 MAG: hypothetical protein B7Z01_00885 [Brevundimonas subvibrioides]
MNRGDVVTAVLPREQGKPRPVVIVQSDTLTGSNTVIICPLTSRVEFQAPHRPQIEPSEANGLRSTSLAMTDKLQATPRDRCGFVIGRLEDGDLSLIEAGIVFVLGMQR